MRPVHCWVNTACLSFRSISGSQASLVSGRARQSLQGDSMRQQLQCLTFILQDSIWVQWRVLLRLHDEVGRQYVAYLDLAAQLCLDLPAVLSRAWPLCFLADLPRFPCSSLVQGPAHSFTPLLPL